jgi:hypothetical protein
MIKDNVIKHINSMDVCFEIVNVIRLHNKVKLKGYWINMGFKTSWILLGKTSTIEIFNKDISNWLVSCGNDTNPGCHRKDNWRVIDKT